MSNTEQHFATHRRLCARDLVPRICHAAARPGVERWSCSSDAQRCTKKNKPRRSHPRALAQQPQHSRLSHIASARAFHLCLTVLPTHIHLSRFFCKDMECCRLFFRCVKRDFFDERSVASACCRGASLCPPRRRAREGETMTARSAPTMEAR